MTIQIPTELDNGSFYYNVILANTSAVDLYRPRIGTESRLIQALVYNNMGEDVTDSMQWLVDETDSDFALVPRCVGKHTGPACGIPFGTSLCGNRPDGL